MEKHALSVAPGRRSSALGQAGPGRPSPTTGAAGCRVLTGNTVTLRELRADDAPALFAALIERTGGALHLAAAGDHRRIRPLHQLGDSAAPGRTVCLLRDRAAGIRHRDRHLPGALARAGVRNGGVGFCDCVGILGQRRFSSTAPSWSSTLRSGALGVHRLEARAAVKNGRGNGALRKLGAVQEGVLRRSFLKNGEYLDQALVDDSARTSGSRPRPSGAASSFTDVESRAYRASPGRSVNVRDFDFELPSDLIAQEPPPERGGSRLLFLDRATGAVIDTAVAALAGVAPARRRPRHQQHPCVPGAAASAGASRAAAPSSASSSPGWRPTGGKRWCIPARN